jgi:hypothetical protein
MRLLSLALFRTQAVGKACSLKIITREGVDKIMS